MKHPSEFWDKAAARYDQQSMRKYGNTYRVTIELAAGVKKITAIDHSPAMVSAARGKATARGAGNIEFLVTDVFDRRYDGSRFDAVLAFNILHYLPDPNAALRRIRELVAPAGVFLSATDCWGAMNPMLRTLAVVLSGLGVVPRMTHYTPHGLEAACAEDGFRVLEARSLYPSPPNYFIAARV